MKINEQNFTWNFCKKNAKRTPYSDIESLVFTVFTEGPQHRPSN